MKVSAVILAGGSSSRMGRDKLLMDLFGDTVISTTLKAFKSVEEIDEIVLVGKSSPLADIEVEGGKTRKDSSKKGVLAATGDIVLIHDGARPFVSPDLIKRVISKTKENRSAIPFIPLKDSIKRVENGRIVDSPRRADHVAVQTPQGFFRADILEAFECCSDEITDDSEMYGKVFGCPYIVEGEETNIKLTTPTDITNTSKYAIGYDLHRLETGRRFVLGGIEIPSEKGMIAHSDGDVLLHAVTDAVLSLASMRDIGYYFPDTDPQYKDCDSTTILKRACALAHVRGVQVRDLSAIVIVDKPKLSPYVEEIKSSLSHLLSINKDDISISCKTTEKTSTDTIEVFAVVSKK